MGGRIGAPLLQPFPLGRIVQVLPALRFDDPDFRLAPLDDEIRDVVADAAVGVAVLDPEHRAPAVFDERDDVLAAIEEAQLRLMGLVEQNSLVTRRQCLPRIDHRFELFFFAIGERQRSSRFLISAAFNASESI